MSINGVNNKNLIDASAIGKVSADLFTALQKKSVDYSKVDLTKFSRQSLGIDLYSQKTDLDFQRQIAIANSGVFEANMELNSVKALNALAAQALYGEATANKVGGKMTIDEPKVQFEFLSLTQDASPSLNVFETNKDKKDSNPFVFDASNSNETKKKDE